MQSSAENFKSIDSMPGPKEVPSKGNLEDIQHAGDLLRFQLTMHEQFGSLFKFKLNAKTTAISTTNAEILKNFANIFDKPLDVFMFLVPLIGQVMSPPLNDNKALRKFITDKLSVKLLQKKITVIVNVINAEVDNWLQDSQPQGVLRLQEKIKTLSMRIIVSLVCSENFTDSHKLATAIHTALEEGLYNQYQAFPDQKVWTTEKQREALDYINVQVKEFIAERKSKKNVAEAFFLNEILDNLGATLNENDISCIIKLVLMAGYHTTASAVCWTLYEVAKHQQVAQKLYKDIDTLADSEINYIDLKNLDYLHNVIKETLRLYPPGPYSARKANADLDVEGFLIPKDTVLFFPIWTVHHNASYWQNPDVFDPDRFTSGAHYNKKAYMPFGLGVRNCTSSNIASPMIALITLKILQRLNLQEIKDFKPQISETFSLESRNDILIKITPRRKQMTNYRSYFDIKIVMSVLLLAYMMKKSDTFDIRLTMMLSLIVSAGLIYNRVSKSSVSFFHKNSSTEADRQNLILEDDNENASHSIQSSSSSRC
jgi:cytochrome P450